MAEKLFAYSLYQHLNDVRLCQNCTQGYHKSQIQRCSSCKVALYCGQTCQKAHWISHHHKECSNLIGPMASINKKNKRIDPNVKPVNSNPHNPNERDNGVDNGLRYSNIIKLRNGYERPSNGDELQYSSNGYGAQYPSNADRSYNYSTEEADTTYISRPEPPEKSYSQAEMVKEVNLPNIYSRIRDLEEEKVKLETQKKSLERDINQAYYTLETQKEFKNMLGGVENQIIVLDEEILQSRAELNSYLPQQSSKDDAKQSKNSSSRKFATNESDKKTKKNNSFRRGESTANGSNNSFAQTTKKSLNSHLKPNLLRTNSKNINSTESKVHKKYIEELKTIKTTIEKLEKENNIIDAQLKELTSKKDVSSIREQERLMFKKMMLADSDKEEEKEKIWYRFNESETSFLF